MLGNDEPIPNEWPRNLNPPPSVYFHRHTLADAVKLRKQGLTRYRKNPQAWIAKVREWQQAHHEYVAAYQAWWWKVYRNEERLKRIREYTKQWSAAKKGLLG